jgi:hypothetical protein
MVKSPKVTPVKPGAGGSTQKLILVNQSILRSDHVAILAVTGVHWVGCSAVHNRAVSHDVPRPCRGYDLDIHTVPSEMMAVRLNPQISRGHLYRMLREAFRAVIFANKIIRHRADTK